MIFFFIFFSKWGYINYYGTVYISAAQSINENNDVISILSNNTSGKIWKNKKKSYKKKHELTLYPLKKYQIWLHYLLS